MNEGIQFSRRLVRELKEIKKSMIQREEWEELQKQLEILSIQLARQKNTLSYFPQEKARKAPPR